MLNDIVYVDRYGLKIMPAEQVKKVVQKVLKTFSLGSQSVKAIDCPTAKVRIDAIFRFISQIFREQLQVYFQGG